MNAPGFPELLLLFFVVVLVPLLAWGAWRLVLRMAEGLGAAWAMGTKSEDSSEKRTPSRPGFCLLVAVAFVIVIMVLAALIWFTRGSVEPVHYKPF